MRQKGKLEARALRRLWTWTQRVCKVDVKIRRTDAVRGTGRVPEMTQSARRQDYVVTIDGPAGSGKTG